MTTYNDGDSVVIAQKDENGLDVGHVERIVYVNSAGNPCVDLVAPGKERWGIRSLEEYGWRVVSHTPKVVLPNGWYRTGEEGKVFSHFDGTWYAHSASYAWEHSFLPDQIPTSSDRLISESEVSARVKAGQREVAEWIARVQPASARAEFLPARIMDYFGLSEDGAE